MADGMNITSAGGLHLHDLARARRQLWHFDAALVDQLCVDHLARFCAAVGTGPALTWMRRPGWWGGSGVSEGARRLHYLPRGHCHCLALQAMPTAEHVLCIHVPSGEWREPKLDLSGGSYVSLAAYRWRVSEVKAAWRLARLFGWATPHLPEGV